MSGLITLNHVNFAWVYQRRTTILDLTTGKVYKGTSYKRDQAQNALVTECVKQLEEKDLARIRELAAAPKEGITIEKATANDAGSHSITVGAVTISQWGDASMTPRNAEMEELTAFIKKL